ncbi:MAG: protease modulator HflC, partial [candidate division Zixibacteria bacterium]|nr:protease modulator HflC [Phycisphaerae bacterium]NIR67738.1 protease modulator HflC [candidate division Zixibacteria bacterium]NIS48988.1 protease modulator HflC [candidate division Zixibacteria bacterium]NIT53234.1 protease modulator HflC [candidate division Zixibacteria bacterium]NIU17074.1 protease modulator HflC [candidate division Zixibacteria bacterium]
RTVLLATAYKEAQTIRGEGDARAAKIYARAFNRDPEFYSFYRSLNAYRMTFGSGKDVLVLQPDSEFFKYFMQQNR